MFTRDDVIFAYTRRQAVADGVLFDVSEMAREAGFKWPVAMTASVWEDCVRVPEGVEGQDEAGRQWDILFMLRHAIRTTTPPGREMRFQLLVRNDNRAPRPVTLKAVIGPDDNGNPCLTVMKPEED